MSGTGFENDSARLTGTRLPGPDIAARAEAGEPPALTAFQRHASRLAVAAREAQAVP